MHMITQLVNSNTRKVSYLHHVYMEYTYTFFTSYRCTVHKQQVVNTYLSFFYFFPAVRAELVATDQNINTQRVLLQNAITHLGSFPERLWIHHPATLVT